MGIIGQSVTRVDAPDKVTGRAKYTDDIADKSALIAKVLHSSIAHGYVKSIDISLSLIHISEPTRPPLLSRMPSSA